MTENTQENIDFTLAYYSGDRKTGSVAVVSRKQGAIKIERLPVLPESGLPATHKPVFVGLTEEHQIVLLDSESKVLSFQAGFPVDAFAAHNYSDPKSDCDWLMNDGDKATGNDELNCGAEGSSVTVIENTNSSKAKFLKTICVGRGHHQANFSYPSDEHPNTPSQAYISNLKDGTVSVISNDPSNSDYLNVVATINLCEAEKENGEAQALPNNAFPHGLVFSPLSGKIYNLNNGYGTIAIIDPASHKIEELIGFKGHSNLFASPCGKYVLGRGADRKSDAQHVIAKLSVFDVVDNGVKTSIDLQDIYISKYFFNPEGSRLYLTTSSSGSDEQKANLKTDAILVFDMTALPALTLVNEVRLGASTGTLDFVCDDQGETRLMFASNSANGAITVMDKDGNLLETIQVGENVAHSRLWCL